MNVQAGQIRRLVDDLVSLVGGNDRGIKLIGKESAYRIFRGFGQKYPLSDSVRIYSSAIINNGSFTSQKRSYVFIGPT